MRTQMLGNAIAAMGVALVALSGSTRAQTPSDYAEWGPVIAVSGTGEVEHEPNMAQIHVGVVTQAESAVEAVAANNAKMQQLLAAVREQGIAERDIQTSSLQVTPQRSHREPEPRRPEAPQPPRIIGYEVTNQVRITARDLGKLGEVLDAAVQQGANQVHGIHFSVEDERELMREALRKAVAEAREKAAALAGQADVELGRLLLIQESGQPIPRPMMARAMQAEAADMPVSPGTLTIRADVSVVFGIGSAPRGRAQAQQRWQYGLP